MNILVNRLVTSATLTLTAAFLAGTAFPSRGETSAENEKAKKLFRSNCASCHGQDGAGTALGKSMEVPDLRSEQVQKHTDAELAQVVIQGTNNMPAFKNRLSEDQVHDVVRYVRELGKKKESTEKQLLLRHRLRRKSMRDGSRGGDFGRLRQRQVRVEGPRQRCQGYHWSTCRKAWFQA